MKKLNVTQLLIFIVSAELVGALSALLSGNSFSAYSEYTKPPLSPPAGVFPVVWAILYALMGISAYIVYNSDSAEKGKALTIYAVQLFVNFIWSIVFFRFQSLWASAVIIIVLLLLIIAMILKFRKISPCAAYINIPYLLWVIFASYLNIAICVINLP